MSEGEVSTRNVGQVVSLGLIRGYQIFLSPLVGARCRFEPSCSRFTAEAIETHGVFAGSWLGIKRIGRCQPWNDGGYDPVPQSIESSHTQSGQGSPS